MVNNHYDKFRSFYDFISASNLHIIFAWKSWQIFSCSLQRPGSLQWLDSLSIGFGRMSHTGIIRHGGVRLTDATAGPLKAPCALTSRCHSELLCMMHAYWMSGSDWSSSVFLKLKQKLSAWASTLLNLTELPSQVPVTLGTQDEIRARKPTAYRVSRYVPHLVRYVSILFFETLVTIINWVKLSKIE